MTCSHQKYLTGLVTLHSQIDSIVVLPAPSAPRKTSTVVDVDRGHAQLHKAAARAESPRQESQQILAFTTNSSNNSTIGDSSAALVGKLDRTQEDLMRFGSDMTDLMVQVKILTDIAKTTRTHISGSSAAQTKYTSGTEGSFAQVNQRGEYKGHAGSLNSKASQKFGLCKASTFALPGFRKQRTLRQMAFGDASSLMTVLNKYELQGLLESQNRCGLPNEPERVSKLARALASEAAERLVSLMIVLNVFFLGYSADYAVQNALSPETPFISAGEIVFLVFYSIELVLRLKVHSLFFFTNEEAFWNWLDFVLVFGSVWDVVMTYLFQVSVGNFGSEGAFNVSFLRVLRVFRISKVFRILRVMRYFSELRMMLSCIIMSLKPLFWCMLNMIMFYSIFAITFLHGVAGYLADEEADPVKKQDLVKDWGSLGIAILSLYQATTGGVDWAVLLDTLWVTGPFYVFLFLLFTAFMILAVMNIMTGIFCDRAIRYSAEDREGMMAEKLFYERKMVEDLTRLFCMISGNSVAESGALTKSQFEEALSLPAMRMRFAVMGLEIWDASRFYSLLSSMSADGTIDAHVFVVGCMQLRSDPKGIAVQGILKDIEKLGADVAAMRQVLSGMQTDGGHNSDALTPLVADIAE